MSWYVSTLIKRSQLIKAKEDIDSDEYNDLIVLEKKIKDLCNLKLISEKEMLIIEAMKSCKSSYQLEKDLNLDRITIYKIFNDVSDRLSYYLGSEYTDVGYLTYLKNKYKLTEEQLNKVIKFINSNYKFNISKGTK
jgi:hypothetical protein